MASTMETNEVVLYDLVPGPVHFGEIPLDGFTGSRHHNVQAADDEAILYPYGYKCSYYDEVNTGYSILAYLQYNAGDVTLAAGHICSVESAGSWYQVTNDGDTGDVGCYIAIALSAMDDAHWGFFWVGGVCPEGKVTALAAAQLDTDGSVAAGNALELVDLTTPDRMGLDQFQAGTATSCVGFALAADD